MTTAATFESDATEAEPDERVSPSSIARRRLLETEGGPALLADWRPILFLHYAVEPAALAPHVPFPLDTFDGRAYVSVVAFTQHGLRPRLGGRLTAALSRPLATHPFLNVRTYVRVDGEPGICFLAEWIPNRLAVLIGPRLYGLPYRIGRLAYERGAGTFAGEVAGPARLRFRATVCDESLAPAAPGTLDAFLLERYAAFTRRGATTRRFRIWHAPWPMTRAVGVAIEYDALLRTFPWFEDTRPAGAHYSPGVTNVWIGRPTRLDDAPPWHTWVPLIALPAAAIAVGPHLPPWVFMWALAAAIFAGCKWATLFRVPATLWSGPGRAIAYLFGFAGMDAGAFLDRTRRVAKPRPAEWGKPGATIVAGALMLFVLPRLLTAASPLVVGWVGMIGAILLLHFGVLHALSLLWRRAGVDAPPLMNRPLASRSAGEFWGARWNTGFHRLAEDLVFRPAARRLGVAGAVMLTFLASGLVHDLVITLPAGAGYGLPTLYFLLQGAAVLLERRPVLRRRPGLRRAVALAVLALPAPLLLFPPAFVTRVFVPFMNAIGAL